MMKEIRHRKFLLGLVTYMLAAGFWACGNDNSVGAGSEPEPNPETDERFTTGDLVIDLPNGAKMPFIRIEAGTFVMGESFPPVAAYPRNDSSAVPQHRITITQPFYLSKYEVTRKQWAGVMGVDALPEMPDYAQESDYPVSNITWDQCQSFINHLNGLTGKNLYILPTEAQWEYACRAGTTTTWSFGNFTDFQIGMPYMWFTETSGGNIHPVGLKLPNPWGLYDMHGNVSEWVYDWYSPYSDEPQTDPQGPDEPPFPYDAPSLKTHVRRGGSAGSDYFDTRSTQRFHLPGRFSLTGFRISRKATD